MATSTPVFHLTGLSKAFAKHELSTDLNRKAPASGSFCINMDIHFDAAISNLPSGKLAIETNICAGGNASFVAYNIELINAYGKQTPTIYLTGLCGEEAEQPDLNKAYRYWLMVVDRPNNKHSLDILGFCIQDRAGNRIAYGTNM